MKIPIVKLASLLVLLILSACISEPKVLPVLTYEGNEPKVQVPLSPEESQQHIQLPEGFRAELFAAEPDIINPIAFTWDERGRLWVVQSKDYPHELENDVGGDRITICEDTDGDGKADKFIDYATKQSLTTGIVKVKGGIIVPQAPEMVFLQDTDGDDKMDKRTVLFDGFGIWDTHAGPANLKYGIDNMIWGSVGYSGFQKKFGDKDIDFKMGVYRFAKNGRSFEPIGQFNNNTWGLGWNENFEIFGSTANNNHACYVGIPMKHYEYLYKLPKWALNADFIQGHYEITSPDTIPLQQVDVRGGYTAAAGANFYTARNYPAEYQNQMYVNEPTGHLVHLARIERDGAGYKEVDGGNIFASTDAWTAPVFSETGPDGNLWIADWYNPVIQHNPDKRGMDNQIWNADKGEGNAHLNKMRDKTHGRIYIIKYKKEKSDAIASMDRGDDAGLLAGLGSDNLFWRTTAQRLIVEENKQSLIPDLLKMASNEGTLEGNGLNAPALHAVWTLDGLQAFDGGANVEVLKQALSSGSYAVQRAATQLLPNNEMGSKLLAESGLFSSEDSLAILTGLLRASELPETDGIFKAIQQLIDDPNTMKDKWLSAAIKMYQRVEDLTEVDPSRVAMLIPSGEKQKSTWKYVEEKPADNWYATDFKDGNWQTGATPIGGDDFDFTKTVWKTDDVWMRKSFNLTKVPKEPVLKIMHDDNYEVYINGELLNAEAGYSNREYKYILVDEEKAAFFKKGKNTIAVYCHNGGGGKYIDVGLGEVTAMKADVTFNLNSVNQKMEFDKTILKAKAGQTVRIRLNNGDEMPHNLVILRPGSFETFGGMVDGFLNHPKAEEMGYVPKSRYVLGATGMLDPGESGEVVFELPDQPGRYPYVCTFPGHWRTMKGEIIVTAPGSYLLDDPSAPQMATMGGGGSHNFLEYFGKADGKVMSQVETVSITYTENVEHLNGLLKDMDVLMLTNNKPFDRTTKNSILARVRAGMGMMVVHPSTWYNWTDWPVYNKEIVGGGSRSHEKLQEFEVEVVKPDHPIMQGVPAKFKIFDELYRWEKDADAEIEILAIGRGIESGKEYPVVWTVKHPNSNIVGNTLGHDERAHNLQAYKTIMGNSLKWIVKKMEL